MKYIFSIICVLVIAFSFSTLHAEPLKCSENSGFAVDKYPVTHGSYHTKVLRQILLYKLLGIDYQLKYDKWGGYCVEAVDDDDSHTSLQIIEQKDLVKCYTTDKVYTSLVDEEVGLVITPRKPTAKEEEMAAQNNVNLVSKPIARDALVVAVCDINPIENITVSQLRDIYFRRITSWEELDIANGEIAPYRRRNYYDCEQWFESMVMDNEMPQHYPMYGDELMDNLLMSYPHTYPRGISFASYYEQVVLKNLGEVKLLNIDGIEPTKENIVNGTYPLKGEITQIYACIREEDLYNDSPEAKLYDFLTTPEGQSIVEESGYIPLYPTSSIAEIDTAHCSISISDKKICISGENPELLSIYDVGGTKCLEIPNPGKTVDVGSLKRGLYVVSVHTRDSKTLNFKILL